MKRVGWAFVVASAFQPTGKGFTHSSTIYQYFVNTLSVTECFARHGLASTKKRNRKSSGTKSRLEDISLSAASV